MAKMLILLSLLMAPSLEDPTKRSKNRPKKKQSYLLAWHTVFISCFVLVEKTIETFICDAMKHIRDQNTVLMRGWVWSRFHLCVRETVLFFGAAGN